MRTILFLKDSGNYKEGDLATVQNNTAHYYIDSGVARLFNPRVTEPQNRMISDQSNNYKVKDESRKLRNSRTK